MENKTPNHSIGCTVTQCANHAKTENYCALDSIRVGTHEQNPKAVQCTDCESFVLGSDSSCEGCR